MASPSSPKHRDPATEGVVFWLTGLSGAGKTTVAMALKDRLAALGQSCMVLDGDQLRAGINADLGFSDADRRENARRIAHMAKLISVHGGTVVVAAITPRAADRALARSIVGEPFYEVYIGTSLSACEARDPKGLYQAARKGRIETFTGVSAVYEVPTAPDLTLNTESLDVDEEVDLLLAHLVATRASASAQSPATNGSRGNHS